jgi:hypothetical protein
MGFLYEFFLVHCFIDVSSLVENVFLFFHKCFDFFRNAYVALQYIIQQSYSVERTEEE